MPCGASDPFSNSTIHEGGPQGGLLARAQARPGQDLKRDSVVVQSKTEYLEAFLDDFEVLKPEVRLCVDLKILPMNKQAEVAILMDSNGRRITGWRTAGP